METLTTISEIAKVNLLSATKVRDIFTDYNVNPVEKRKVVVNGFQGHPYLLDEAKKALKLFNKKKNKIKVFKPLKKYSNEEVCKVLRKHIKHPLNNKEIFLWNYYDWIEFNKLNEAENGKDIRTIENTSERNSGFVN